MQLSTSIQEEHRSIFDRVVNTISDVKETILNIGSSNEKISSDIPEQSNILGNYEEQQTLIEPTEKTINNTNKKILSTKQELIETSPLLSSTTHEKTASPTTTSVSNTMLGSDIDLEPIIIHGNPDIATSTPSTIPQTISTTSKKKQKKRKKDKQEMVLFDAPELTSLHSNKEEQQHKENITKDDFTVVNQTCDYESLPTTIVSATKSNTLCSGSFGDCSYK